MINYVCELVFKKISTTISSIMKYLQKIQLKIQQQKKNWIKETYAFCGMNKFLYNLWPHVLYIMAQYSYIYLFAILFTGIPTDFEQLVSDVIFWHVVPIQDSRFPQRLHSASNRPDWFLCCVFLKKYQSIYWDRYKLIKFNWKLNSLLIIWKKYV